MRVLSAILLVLSSSNFHVAVSSGIRGAGPEIEDTTHQQQSSRDLAENNGKGLFGEKNDESPDEAKPVTKSYDEEDEEDPPAPPAKKSDSLVDARLTADMLNLSLDDARELLKQQQDFAKLVDDLQDDIDFLQAEMPSEPNGEFVIKYKNGNVPKKREKGIKQFMNAYKNAQVKSVPAKLSLRDAESRGQRLADMLGSKGYSNVSFSIDGDEIELIAKKPPGQGKGKDVGKISSARTAEILDLQEDDSDLEEFALLLVEDDDEDPSKPDHTYGGSKITGNGQQCTTAFSVEDSSGTTGISTAAHCTGMNWFHAPPGEWDYSIYFEQEHKGIFGDIEWYTTPHMDVAEYYATATLKWPVRSVAASVSRNQVVCGYSRMRNIRWCDLVRSTNVSVQYSGHPRMHRLVAMMNHRMVDGDSGGPWSYYDRAFGIHSGSTTICAGRFLWFRWGCRQRDVWSRASFLLYALGVTVRTHWRWWD